MYIFYSDRWDGNSGGTSVGAGMDLTRLIDAEADTEFATAADVLAILAYLGVFKGSIHPLYSYALLTSLRAERTDDPRLWLVTAEYAEAPMTFGEGTLYPGGDPGGSEDGTSPATPSPAPEDRAPTFKIVYRRKDTFPTKDLDGFSFSNPAGDRYDNPPPVPRSMMVVTFTTWKAADAWDATVGQAYFEKVNSLAWIGFAARTATVVGLEAALILEGGYLAWKLDYTIEVGSQTCNTLTNAEVTAGVDNYADHIRIAQYGYNVLGTASDFTTKKEYVNPVDNKPPASPIKLNGNGTIRAADLAPLCFDFRIRDTVNFAGL